MKHPNKSSGSKNNNPSLLFVIEFQRRATEIGPPRPVGHDVTLRYKFGQLPIKIKFTFFQIRLCDVNRCYHSLDSLSR